VIFPWSAGDVLILDNMLMMHGRQPYEGERRVLVAMA
jgi:alpha-ketoglutarate-dependent taurine dioxygenase